MKTDKPAAGSRCIIKINGTRLALAEKPSGETLATLFEVFSGARVVSYRYKYNEPRNETIEGEVYEDAAEIGVSFNGGPFLEEAEWQALLAEWQGKNEAAQKKGGEA